MIAAADRASLHVDRAVAGVWRDLLAVLRTRHGYAHDYARAAKAHEAAWRAHGSAAEDRANLAANAGTRAIGKKDFDQAQQNAAALWKEVHSHNDQASWHREEAERLRAKAKKLKKAAGGVA